MTKKRFAAATLLVSLAVLSAGAQEKAVSSRPSPASQITGKLIGTDGVHQLILEYPRAALKATFIGKTHSACSIPSKSSPSGSIPLDLSSIPKGSQMTLFYIRHGKYRRENLVLSLRFDKVNGESSLPQGKMIPCFKPAEPSAAARK